MSDSDSGGATIDCRNLVVRYGETTVLDGMDLVCHRGRVHAFLGRNGSGKSTTIRAILGLLTPDAGSISLFGKPWERASLRRIGASVDGPALYGHLNARDNLTVHARLIGASNEQVSEALELVGLADTGRKKARSFSTGMRMRLSLGIAMLGNPELLILDEPQNGLDPQGIVDLRHLLHKHAAAGGTVLVSSHQLGEVVHLADDITILSDGRRRYGGALAQFAPPGGLEQRFLELTSVPSIEQR